MNIFNLDKNKLYILSSYSENTASRIINFFLTLNKIIAEINHKNKQYNSHVVTHTGLLAYHSNNWFVYEVSYEGNIYNYFKKKNKVYYVTELFQIKEDTIEVLHTIYSLENSEIKCKYDKKYNIYTALFSIKIYPNFNNKIKNFLANIINFIIRLFYFSKYFLYNVFNRGGFKIGKNCTARAISTIQEIFWTCQVNKSTNLSGINNILQKYEGSYYGVYPQEIINNCHYEILEF